MPELRIGAAGIADVGRSRPDGQSGGISLGGAFGNASTWTVVFTVAGIGIILGLYFGFGGYKGDVAS